MIWKELKKGCRIIDDSPEHISFLEKNAKEMWVAEHLQNLQDYVHDLEECKGFGHKIEDKLLWMMEEVGELVHSFKHNEKDKIAEEAIDVIFFAVSILSILGVNGSILFHEKLIKNLKRVPVKTENEFHFDKSKERLK